MSIYSGLPTREDQKNYNGLLVRLLQTLQSHLIESTAGIIPVKYANKYQKIIGKMETYEEHKYLPPKFSTLLTPLIKSIYSNHPQLGQNLSQGTIDKLSSYQGLQSVKQEQQMPTGRDKSNKKLKRQHARKNQSETAFQNESKCTKHEFHIPKAMNPKTRYSSSENRRSSSVFSINKRKFMNTKDSKSYQKSEHHLKTEPKLQKKQPNSFFGSKSNPLKAQQQKKRKVHLSNDQITDTFIGQKKMFDNKLLVTKTGTAKANIKHSQLHFQDE